MSDTQKRHNPYFHEWWAAPPEEERRFRIIFWLVLLVLAAAGTIIPFIPVQRPDLTLVHEIPPRLAKLMLEQRQPPPPPPEVREPEPPPPEPDPEPKSEPEPKPEPKAEPQAKPPAAEPPPPPRATLEAARRKAARSGLLALRSELAELRSGSREVLKKLERKKPKPLKKAVEKPSAAPVLTAPPEALAREAAKASAGIDTSRLSRETGDTQLAEHQVERVVSPGDSALQAPRPATRTSEEIQLVFDRNKGRLNTLYNRALRKNPALAGKVVLRLTIAPSGEVTACEIVSSELQDPVLERKLVARVLLFDFGAKEVPEITIDYPLEFFPG